MLFASYFLFYIHVKTPCLVDLLMFHNSLKYFFWLEIIVLNILYLLFFMITFGRYVLIITFFFYSFWIVFIFCLKLNQINSVLIPPKTENL